MPPKRSIEMIDLTNDDASPRPSQSRRFESGYQAPDSYSQSDRDGWLDPSEEGAADDIVLLTQDGEYANGFSFQLYGILDTKIVGCRHYRGLANIGEYVILRREPTNAYDSNAIQVVNLRNEQLGHIPRTTASKLAKYMDNGSIQLEGSLTGRVGDYEGPIALKLFGTSDPIERANLRSQLKADRLPSQVIDQKEREAKKRKAEELKKIAAAKKSKGMKGSGGQQWDASNQLGYSGAFSQGVSQDDGIPTESLDDIVEGAQSFNPREMGEVVEKFGLDEDALAAMPMADCPSKLATTLLPYQRQAVSSVQSFICKYRINKSAVALASREREPTTTSRRLRRCSSTVEALQAKQKCIHQCCYKLFYQIRACVGQWWYPERRHGYGEDFGNDIFDGLRCAISESMQIDLGRCAGGCDEQLGKSN